MISKIMGAFDAKAALDEIKRTIGEAEGLSLARPQVIAALKQIRKDIRQNGLQTLQNSNDGLLCARILALDHEKLVQIICQLVADDNDKGWPKGLGFCAIGGFGRSELAPGSDLDILFLFKRDTKYIQETIEKVLYLLWDCGLKIGHASRTFKQAVELAVTDHTIATAMLDLRVLFGPEHLGDDLERALRRNWSQAKNRKFVASKLEERDIRHERKGPTRYLVEPNVKEGKGGLRDLQSLIWIARRVEPDAVTAGGKNLKFFTASEYRRFQKINRFLWTIRCWLHFISGRAEDRLSFDLQPQLAKKLKYRETASKPAVERLMKAYFLNAREVGFLTRIFCAKLEENANKKFPAAKGKLSTKNLQGSLKQGFRLVNGRLDFSPGEIDNTNVDNLIELFFQADRHLLQIHPDALSHIRSILPTLRAGSRIRSQTRSAFLEHINNCRDLQGTMRLMSETGLLGRLLPEFGRIVGQTQFNMYHSYTVDEHTFRALGFLQDLQTGRMRMTGVDMEALLAKTSNWQVLIIAMLLHDTGKGLGDQEQQGAIATRKACARLGLAPAEIDLAGWLVENHLLFSDIAQGRDLSDPETLRRFAAKIGSLERLRLLFALTVADIRAVGPGVWTEWKGQLFGELYIKTEHILLGKTQIVDSAKSVDQIKDELQAALPDDEFWARWLVEPDENYWLSFPKFQLLQHAKMLRSAWQKNQKSIAQLFSNNDDQLTSLVVWARDMPGLFAALCAIATASGAAIASAKVITTTSKMAFDVFLLHDGRGGAFAANNPRALKRMQDMLDRYLTDWELPRAFARRRSRREAAFQVMSEVVIDNESSERATLIECVGADAHGLLRDLSQTLNQCQVNIHSAHITTYGERAVDIFYVNERNGGKIRNARRREFIRRKLLQVLDQFEAEKQEGQVEQARASRYR